MDTPAGIPYVHVQKKLIFQSNRIFFACCTCCIYEFIHLLEMSLFLFKSNDFIMLHYGNLNEFYFFILGVLAADHANLPVQQKCLGCLCEASSLCDTTTKCTGDVCGPFRLTWAYWADAGKPTLNNESKESTTAYSNCASDVYCSALAVQGYMQKFQQVT